MLYRNNPAPETAPRHVSLPPIDLQVPARLETATFASG